MTEHEVYQGLINITSESARSDNCLLFKRDIDDLFDNIDHRLAKRFCDVIWGTDETDGAAQVKLNSLKVIASKALPKFNSCETEVSLILIHTDASSYGVGCIKKVDTIF